MGEGVLRCLLIEIIFTFEGFYVSANFGENPSTNASVRVHAEGKRLTGFLICAMLKAIASRQIITGGAVDM